MLRLRLEVRFTMRSTSLSPPSSAHGVVHPKLSWESPPLAPLLVFTDSVAAMGEPLGRS
jgi:hypothetical protein